MNKSVTWSKPHRACCYVVKSKTEGRKTPKKQQLNVAGRAPQGEKIQHLETFMGSRLQPVIAKDFHPIIKNNPYV